MTQASPIPVGHFADIAPVAGAAQRIHYHDQGAGEVLIFLHGAGGGASGYSNFKGNYPVFAQAGYRSIVPDLLVDEYADGDGINSMRLREADLQKHLSNDREKEAAADVVDELEEQKRLAALEKKRKPLEFGSKEDFQLAQALNHLKGQPVQLSKSAKIESKKEPTINNPDGTPEKSPEKK